MRRYCHSLSLWLENSYTLKQKATLNAISCLFTIIVIITPIAATATEYSIPENGSRLIGVTESYKVGPGDYFQTIARFYNIGLIALMESNPGIDPLLPPLGTELKIPTQMLLPDVPYRGIVINLPEFRLYYFPKGTNKVHVFPVGIGRVNRPTPIMNSRIKSKIKNPSWTPNARIKADYFSKYGKELPSVIPPGENNPLGKYALQLEFGYNNYWIHGTNQNFGIGMRVSAGCVRMNPGDIAWLFKQVMISEEVRIINQPIKLATEPNGSKTLEVHSPLSISKRPEEYDLNTQKAIIKLSRQDEVNNHELEKALLLHQGIPVKINI